MSEFDTEEVEPEEAPDQEEYVGEDPGAISPDTGTLYDEQGTAEATPHDETDDDEDDE